MRATTEAGYRRARYRVGSNNPVNPNRNLCTLAIADALGVGGAVRYLHTFADTLRAIRTQYLARSRRSSVRGSTVGAIRGQLEALGALYYLVHVDGHVLLLGRTGETLIDTAPRKRDRRKVRRLYGIWRK